MCLPIYAGTVHNTSTYCVCSSLFALEVLLDHKTDGLQRMTDRKGEGARMSQM